MRRNRRSICVMSSVFCFLTLIYFSCKKDDGAGESVSSLKIIPTKHEPKLVRIVSSDNGVNMVYTYSGNVINPAVGQEFYILDDKGNVIKSVTLTDSIYQYIDVVPAYNGGFFICAATDLLPGFVLYLVDDAGTVVWRKPVPVLNGTLINKPALTRSIDNNYWITYQSQGYGFYLFKCDQQGNPLLHKKIQTPNSKHSNFGLNWGETFDRIVQVNDTLLAIQGINIDQYSDTIDNCFVRGINENADKTWYSTNFDSTQQENSAAIFARGNSILLFGTRSQNRLNEGFGDPFVRTYTLNGVLQSQLDFTRINHTPVIVKNVIPAADNGYLLIGSDNQLPSNDVVSNNRIVLYRLNQDLSVRWTKEIQTHNPSKGFDAAFMSDGTIAVTGLIKQDYSVNSIIYFHLTAGGEIVL
jgi:hypothetical protein